MLVFYMSFLEPLLGRVRMVQHVLRFEGCCVCSPHLLLDSKSPTAIGLQGLREFLYGWWLFHYFEIFFSDTTEGAYPVVGNFFKRCSGSDSSIGVSHGRVVNPIAYDATILFHNVCLLRFYFLFS